MMTMKRKSNFQMTTMSIEIAIICFVIGSIFPLQTTSTPIEIAQLVGRTVSLNCPKNSSDGIIWKFNENAPFYNGREFRGDQFKDRCRFENDSATGNEILRISDIKPEDAGLYRCLIASTETLLQSTQLTVLDSEPTFDSNNKDNEFVGPTTCGLNQDDMRFTCAVSYRGAKAPRLQWEDVKNNQILKDIKCDGSQPNRTNCTLTLKAEPRYDGSKFRCKVMTSHGEQYSCSTKAIKVLYFIQKNDSRSSEATNGEIYYSVKTNQKYRRICKLQEDSKDVESWGSNVGLYNCIYSYRIKTKSCSAELPDVIEPYTEFSLSLKSLAIVNSLVLVVFAVVSYFVLENEKVKNTLENIYRRLFTSLKISLIVFVVLDFALLMFILVSPTDTLLHMKYAHTVALLLLIFVDALLLLLMRCEVSSPTVKSIEKIILKLIPFILPLLALFDAVFVIATAVIVNEEFSNNSNPKTKTWVAIFKFILVSLVPLALFPFVGFVFAKRCFKNRQSDPLQNSSAKATISSCCCCCWRILLTGNDGERSKRLKIIHNMLLDALRTKEWAAPKRDILSALKSHGAINDSDYKKILVKNDDEKGISMLIDAIQRGSKEDYKIFKMVIKEILVIDIDDATSVDECSNQQQIIEARISDAILTIGWAAEKDKILSALHSGGASDESDFAKIFSAVDGIKGILMLAIKILRGSGNDYIFKDAMKDILKIDLDNVDTSFPKLTIEWAKEKHTIRSALDGAIASEKSDFAQIRGEEDGKKGISMLVAKILRGSGKDYILKPVMRDILKIDLENVISDAILTIGWAVEKQNIRSALNSDVALGDSDVAKILDVEDGKKGISMLVATILRGSEKYYNIFKPIMKDSLNIDLGDVGTIFVKKNDAKAKRRMLRRCCPWFSGRKTEAPEKSETQPHELDPLGKGSAVNV